MIDSRTVGKAIATHRQRLDLTQQELADRTFVSHQAVSKWENGAALPDTQTLLTLGKLFDTPLETLLLGVTEPATQQGIIRKNPFKSFLKRHASATPHVEEVVGNGEYEIMNEAPAIVEEIPVMPNVEVPIFKESVIEAPALAPKEPKAETSTLKEEPKGETNDKKPNVNWEYIMGMAPFMDESTIELLIGSADMNSLNTHNLVRLAPFMSPQSLARIVDMVDIETDFQVIHRLAPFLDKKTLDKLLGKINGAPMNGHMLKQLAPFLSRESLDNLVENMDIDNDTKEIVGLAPFLSSATLNKLIDKCTCINDFEKLISLAPFLRAGDLSRLVKKMIDDGLEANWNSIKCLAPFLDQETLQPLVAKLEDDMDFEKIQSIAPFINKDTINRTVKKALERDLKFDLKHDPKQLKHDLKHNLKHDIKADLYINNLPRVDVRVDVNDDIKDDARKINFISKAVLSAAQNDDWDKVIERIQKVDKHTLNKILLLASEQGEGDALMDMISQRFHDIDSTTYNKVLLQLSEEDETDTVMALLNQNPKMISEVTIQKILNIACENENEELIECLIDKCNPEMLLQLSELAVEHDMWNIVDKISDLMD